MTRRQFSSMLVLFQPAAACAQRPARAEDLIEIIQQEQRKHVRESTGIWAHECFTDEDLARFRSSDQARKIAESLRKSSRILAVVAEIRKLESPSRDELLAQARRVRRPTWEELGYIDPSRKGQTRAGAAAESMIAAELVKLVSAMVPEEKG